MEEMRGTGFAGSAPPFHIFINRVGEDEKYREATRDERERM